MPAAELEETSSTNVPATYDRGFSLLKDATLRENKHDYAEAKKLYIDGCAVFMQLKEVEKDPEKKETIRRYLSEFITAAERVDKKMKTVTPEMPTRFTEMSDVTTENGEGVTSWGKTCSVDGELEQNNMFRDTEAGEGLPYDDTDIEIIVRKTSKSRYGLLVCIILTLVSVIIIGVALTRGSGSSTNNEAHTMNTG